MHFGIGFISGCFISSINLSILYYIVKLVSAQKFKPLIIIFFIYIFKLLFTGIFLFLFIKNHYGNTIGLLIGATIVFSLFIIGVFKNATASRGSGI